MRHQYFLLEGHAAPMKSENKMLGKWLKKDKIRAKKTHPGMHEIAH